MKLVKSVAADSFVKGTHVLPPGTPRLPILRLSRNTQITQQQEMSTPEMIGVQGIEPAEIYTQKVIITDCVSIYYGVRCAHAL
ncbi:MAG: hypothetical protein PHC50_02760 [Candidatus Cloacimonetes bacterium]|nr:hypothetical protein [Candidatus Cloacimonadota bacterium]